MPDRISAVRVLGDSRSETDYGRCDWAGTLARSRAICRTVLRSAIVVAG